ncbi:hypothetical protein AB0F46_25570 [Streptomyces sp. NPDC026665]|uniref:hypothetical protein n=1 Tax=Streptomyces sp. NPDC026665 TaxID=3154798 RepID=UPI0033D4C9DE
MAFAYGENGWAFQEGPSGAPGHAWNSRGFDGVAFRTEGPLDARIFDNKSYSGTGSIGDASAMTKNPPGNLTKLVEEVSKSAYDTVPRIGEPVRP